jgi:hypothetical protein
MPRTTRCVNEITRSSLRCDLQLSGYSQGFTGSVINSKGRSRPNKEERPLGSVYIPYVKGVSENFKRIGNRYNIRKYFRTKHTLRRSLKKSKLERDPQPTARESSRSYIGQTGRPAEATQAKQADL